MSAKSPPPTTFAPSEGRRVLIVEDEPRLREMLTRAVYEMGFSPTAVSHAEPALRLMEAQDFDILMVDLNLPGMNGLELLEQARARRPVTQAIVLTGFGDLAAARQAIRLDVVDFLTKPCPLGELEVALDRARNRRLRAAGFEPAKAREIAANAAMDDADSGPPRAAPTPSLGEMEQHHILAVLEKNRGNRTATAAELGISLRKLYYRLGQYQKQGRSP